MYKTIKTGRSAIDLYKVNKYTNKSIISYEKTLALSKVLIKYRTLDREACGCYTLLKGEPKAVTVRD